MSTPKDPALDDCGCCEFEPPEQPIFNPPGQPQLKYRIDTQPTFLRRMIDAIPHETVPPDSDAKDARRPLTGLTARAPDDASIALLDAWATAADVLTFYQERIANEGFLRTSTDRRSVLELAREIGYELSPGVAAGADLAFTVESAVGAPRHVPVPIGTKVLSVPGPGQVPQTFETIIAIDARPEWNAFPPRREDPEQVLPGMTDLFLAGTNTNLQVGDPVLFVAGDRVDDVQSKNWDLRLLTAVEVDTPNKRTRVAWKGGLNTTESVEVEVDKKKQAGTTMTRVFAMRKRAQMFGHNTTQFRMLSAETKAGILSFFNDANVAPNDPDIAFVDDWTDDASLPGAGFNLDASSLELKTVSNGVQLDLDINAPKLIVGSWVVLAGTGPSVPDTTPPTTFRFPPAKLTPSPFPLSIGEDPVDLSSTTVPPLPVEGALFRVTAGPLITTRTEFGLTAPITRVITDSPKAQSGAPALQGAPRRGAQFYVESEELALGVRPVIVPVDGKEEIPEIPDTTKLEFQGPTGNFLAVGLSVQGLSPGQRLSLVGKRPNVLVVDTNTLAQRTKTFLAGPLGDGDIAATAPIVAAVQGLLQPPPPDAPLQDDGSPPLGGLILDDPPGAREPLEGHTFELLDQIEADGTLTEYHASVPLKVWKLRSRTGATGTATLPFFAVETVPPATDGETVAEIRTIVAVFQGASRMLLQLDKPLQFIYDRGTLTLSANVAKATHGETVAREVLGNGDPAVANQTFTLKKPPLTYTASPDTPSGSKSTLGIRVNGILWRELPALFGSGPDDQVYITRRTNDGQTDVIFGDGTQGSRLPSGVSNVVATYRTGIGLDGQVDARTLSLLTARPLGVKGAINPLAAAGAAQPAVIDDAKQNAPLTVRTIDRVVSVSDVEDFARSFAGIGKAQARLLWNGSAQVVQLTVGGADGQPIAPDAELAINLAKALQANGDPSLLLRQPLDSFEEHPFTLTVQLDIDERFEKPNVRDAVRSALLDAFSFARRDFGQSVGEAEILALVQGIPGVIAANVAHLEDEKTGAPGKLLTVGVASFDKDHVFHQAGLLIINPAHLDLSQDLTP